MRALKLFVVVLICFTTILATGCAKEDGPPPGTGVVVGFEDISSNASSEQNTSSQVVTSTVTSTPSSQKPASSATNNTSSANTAQIKTICNEYAKHNLIYTCAQWGMTSKIQYSFQSAAEKTEIYFALDKSQKDFHYIAQSNGEVAEVYYNRSKRLVCTRQGDQLLQATPEQADAFDFDTQIAALEPDTQDHLVPEDVISYSTKDGKTTIKVKYSEKFAEFYEGLGADTKNQMSITFWGDDMDELNEIITITGSFTINGAAKQGTVTVEQYTKRLWNVPAPEWLTQAETI